MNYIRTPRFEERETVFGSHFTAQAINSAWKKFVKDGMRKQDLVDLYDYYDFHRKKDNIFQILRKEIVTGFYKPERPIVVRLEKKFGICRHLLVPTPQDAVVLQTLVETLAPQIKQAQPTDRAFYSRSHGGPPSEEDVDESFPYAWFQLWPRFQEEIYQFTQTFDFVVVTDVANYFDNVSLRQLRNVVSSYSQIDECLLDLLFLILENFNWRPDYLPLTGFGLPQVNFDAPRLLGHGFLFEVDTYLSKETNNNFVRWMDDIDFGVDSVEKAKSILQGLDAILLTRGLRLNLGKTKILSQEGAREYFLVGENRYLTVLSKRLRRKIAIGESIDEDLKRLRKRFQRFLKMKRVGRWDKVYKRYFTTFGLAGDPYLQKYAPSLLENSSDIRLNIFAYYRKLGPSKIRLIHLLDLYLREHSIDDASIYSISRLLVEWHIPPRSKLRKVIVELAKNTFAKSDVFLVGSMWMLAKYGTDEDVVDLVRCSSERWKRSPFLARQVAALIPRLRQNEKVMRFVLKSFHDNGLVDALSVVYSQDDFRRSIPFTKAETGYMTHGSREITHYPLAKYLMLLDILQNEKIPTNVRRDIRQRIMPRIPDPLYRKSLLSIQL